MKKRDRETETERREKRIEERQWVKVSERAEERVSGRRHEDKAVWLELRPRDRNRLRVVG